MMKKIFALLLLGCMMLGTLLPAAALDPEDQKEMTATEHSIPLFGCNTALGPFVVDDKDYKAGKSSLSYTLGTYQNANGETVTNDGQAAFTFHFADTIGKESIDASKMDTLEFWIYVSDVDALASISFVDHCMELTSAGTYDQEETGWRLDAILAQCTQNGWNEIRLAIPDTANREGATDWTRLNYMRWYFVRAAILPQTPIVIKIDNIRLTDYAAQQKAKAEPMVTQMAEDIQKSLQDIPEWDAENEEILAQYLANYKTWSASFKEIENEIRGWSDVAQTMMAEHENNVILNRVRRYLRRFEEYLDEHPELMPEPEEETPTIGASAEDEQFRADLKMMLILILIGAIAVIGDAVVYDQLRKKKGAQASE